MSERIDRLLSRMLLGCATAEELSEIDDWLKADPRHAEFVSRLRQEHDSPASVDTDAAWLRLLAKLPPAPVMSRERTTAASARPRRLPTMLRIAAMLALVTAGAVGVYAAYTLADEYRTVAISDVAAPRGERVAVRLPDGTNVVLAPESRIRYPERFRGNTRAVELEGQAYFDVAVDGTRAFTIRSGHARVTVLGTRFVVRAYTGDSEVEVAVEEGSVAFAHERAGAARLVLAAGDRAQLSHDATEPELVEHNMAGMPDWVSGRLVFRRAPLRDVFVELERYYHLEFTAPDDVRAQSVTFEVSGESEEQLLELLRAVLQANIERQGRSVRITPPAESF